LFVHIQYDNEPILTAKQINELRELKDAIYSSPELYTLDFEKSLIMLYTYGKEIYAYVD
jgi:hypothetical protein